MRLLSNHYCLIKIKFLRSFESVPSGFVFRSPACLATELKNCCRVCHSRLRSQLSLVSKKNVLTKKKEVQWTFVVDCFYDTILNEQNRKESTDCVFFCIIQLSEVFQRGRFLERIYKAILKKIGFAYFG